MGMTATNPATGETIAAYETLNQQQVDAAIVRADAAFHQWRQSTFATRAKHMQTAATLLRERAPALAKLMAEEMGKPLKDGKAEAEKCAWVCEYYAEKAEQFLADEPIETDADESFVTYQPLGVVLAVMPWNFPFWQLFRFAAPALMAGNVGLLKHASNVPGCALAIAEIFQDAGFSDGVFTTLLVGSDAIDAIIEHKLVRAVTLTGSTPAGRAVAKKAGEMLKKSVLELGGSDPYLILDDADLESAVNTCVSSRLINAGQSCIAAKRFIVVQSQRDAFEKLFVDRMAAAKMGDPMDEETEVGLQARVDLRDDLHEQVQQSIKKGARCLLGGQVPDGPGAYYPPTVLTDVQPGMPAYDEELFGPVAAIIPVADQEEAIRVANDTSFGLGAAVFTQNLARGRHIAATQLQAGACFVNALVKSDPRLPFGGVKESGYGRELSHHGIREFVNVKTVYTLDCHL